MGGQPSEAFHTRSLFGGTVCLTLSLCRSYAAINVAGLSQSLVPVNRSSKSSSPRPSCQPGANALRATGSIVSFALCHQVSAESRMDSTTSDSGLASLNSRQNREAGHSTVAMYSLSNSFQSGFPPASARAQPG